MFDGCDSLIENMSGNFADVYAGQRPAFISRACGRVELLGGHTDYNEGFIIAAEIDKSCLVAVSKRDDDKVCLYSEWAKEKHEFELTNDLEPADDCRWANYTRGAAALLLQEGLPMKGANLYIAGDVPVGGRIKQLGGPGCINRKSNDASVGARMRDRADTACSNMPKSGEYLCEQPVRYNGPDCFGNGQKRQGCIPGLP
jgi:galactokinase